MDMAIDQKKFSDVFKNLPEDLRGAVYAQETGEDVEAICDRNKIPEQFDYMIDGILSVYMGSLKPEDFFAGLEKRLEGRVSVKQIELEINKFLISPYKNSLEQLYKSAAAASPSPATEVAAN